MLSPAFRCVHSTPDVHPTIDQISDDVDALNHIAILAFYGEGIVSPPIKALA